MKKIYGNILILGAKIIGLASDVVRELNNKFGSFEYKKADKNRNVFVFPKTKTTAYFYNVSYKLKHHSTNMMVEGALLCNGESLGKNMKSISRGEDIENYSYCGRFPRIDIDEEVKERVVDAQLKTGCEAQDGCFRRADCK